MGLTRELADFTVRTGYEDFPAPVVMRAKELMIDYVGGVLSGCRTALARTFCRYVGEIQARPEATVLGSDLKTTAAYAAYLNGAFNHVTELESVSQKTSPNPLAALAVSLSLGEKLKRSGRSVLESFILGFELQGRVGGACLQGVSGKGRISIFNHLGAVTAAAKLLNLDVDRTRMALGLAAFQAGGLITNVGSSAHVLELAVAGRDGIESAELADRGLTAQADILETPQGFLDALVESNGCRRENMTRELGRTYQIVDPGITIKKYPCCYRSHRALEAFFDLQSEYGFGYEEVERVIVEMNLYDSYLMKFPQPKDGEEAKFSFPHIMAAAVLNGRVAVDAFSDESIAAPEYRRARDKIEIIVHDDWPPGRVDARTPVKVILMDGRVWQREVQTAREPTEAQLLARFREGGVAAIGSKRTEEALRLLRDLENLDDISALTAVLA